MWVVGMKDNALKIVISLIVTSVLLLSGCSTDQDTTNENN